MDLPTDPRRTGLGARLRRALALALMLAALAAAAAADPPSTREGRERVFNALVEVFRENYWDEDYRDWDAWADEFRADALDAEDRAAFDRAVGRMVADLRDDHSVWIGLVGRGGAGGVGSVEIRPRLGIRYGYVPDAGVVIERVYPATPAAAAGLHRGDVIVGVNDRDLRSGGAVAAQALVRAVESGEVELTVRRQQTTFRLALTPGPFAQDVVAARPQGEMLDSVTGYIYLPTFNRPEIARDVHALIKELQGQGARALVLDLRGNLGGRLGELGLVLGAFVDGPWAQAISRGGIAWQGRYEVDDEQGLSILETIDGVTISVDDLNAPAHFGGPLAVLVDRDNSSAGEIAALVLQDLERAVVVGEATSGNVEALRSFGLPDGSAVLVAVANVESLRSERAYTTGVLPDVEAVETLADLARGYDAPLAEALRLLKGLPFTPNKFF